MFGLTQWSEQELGNGSKDQNQRMESRVKARNQSRRSGPESEARAELESGSQAKGQRTEAGTRKKAGMKSGTSIKAGSSNSKPGSTSLHRQCLVSPSGLNSVPGPIRGSRDPPTRALWHGWYFQWNVRC